MSDFLLFVLVLGTLILGHELGHFIAAKFLGVKVDEFGIGFPPRMLTLFERGGTKFTLNWIPFGGFVRPAGESDPDVPGGLAAASKRVRTTVLLAGPAANIALAFVAFLIAFKFTAPDLQRVLIAEVAPASPAEQAGMMPGDLVLQVEETAITDFSSLQGAISSHLGQPVAITVERNGQRITLQVTPRPNPPEGEGPIGVLLGNPLRATSWVEATRLSAESIRLQFVSILKLPGRLLSGQAKPEETRVSGLKGIHDMLAWANAIDRTSQRPFLTLNLIGVISVGLAIANLLPFPALDGGRLMFVGLEVVLGKRISPRVEAFANAMGFVLLLLLMVYINLQDFLNPIVLP